MANLENNPKIQNITKTKVLKCYFYVIICKIIAKIVPFYHIIYILYGVYFLHVLLLFCRCLTYHEFLWNYLLIYLFVTLD